MNNKYKELSKNTLIFTISSFGSKFIAFFLVPLYTYILTTTEYGTVDLLTTTAQLLIPTLTINIQDAVLRFSLDKNAKKNDVVFIAYRIIVLSSLVLAIALFFLKFFGLLRLENQYIVFLFLSYFSGTIYNSLTMYIRSINKMKLIAVAGIINTLITCSTNIFLLLVVKMGVTGYMIAYVSGTCIADIILIIKADIFHEILHSRFNKKLFVSMLLYSAPLVTNSIAWWINNASDRYILTFFCGAVANGVYAVAYKIPSILSVIQSTFYNAWSVSAIKEFDKNDSDGFIGNVFSMYCCVSVICCSAIMCCNIIIASLLYSKDFFFAWKFVPLLLAGTVFNGLGLFIGCIFTAVKNSKVISYTTIVGALANTVLNFALIPFWGGIGAAVATFIGYMVVFAARVYKVKDIIRMRLNWIVIIASFVLLSIQCLIATLFEKAVFQIPFFILIMLVYYPQIKKIVIRLVRRFHSGNK